MAWMNQEQNWALPSLSVTPCLDIHGSLGFMRGSREASSESPGLKNEMQLVHWAGGYVVCLGY